MGSRCRMHRKHVIDPGTEVTEGRGLGSGEGIPVRSEVPPPPEKLQHTSKAPTQLYCLLLLIFGIWFDVFPIGTARRRIHLQSATRRRRTDCGLSE